MCGPAAVKRVRRGEAVRALVLVVVMVALTGSGCSVFQRKLPQDPGTNPRLGPQTYLEEGDLVALSVDVSAATQREASPLVPLAVSIADNGVRGLTLGRESFTLVDKEGNRYPLASVAEAKDANVAADYQSARLFFEIVGTTYRGYTYVPCSFFPPTMRDPLRRQRIVRDNVELEPRLWTADLLYFPHPKGTLVGRDFELWMSAPQLKEPVFVKFRVK